MPGPTQTPLFDKLGLGENDLKEMLGSIPAGRFANPQEIAQAIAYPASDEAAFTVGSELI
jgi:NAD(P)-dependent dehydrogenase (short-subunit alcohol dehydrogenase family)